MLLLPPRVIHSAILNIERPSMSLINNHGHSVEISGMRSAEMMVHMRVNVDREDQANLFSLIHESVITHDRIHAFKHLITPTGTMFMDSICGYGGQIASSAASGPVREIQLRINAGDASMGSPSYRELVQVFKQPGVACPFILPDVFQIGPRSVWYIDDPTNTNGRAFIKNHSNDKFILFAAGVGPFAIANSSENCLAFMLMANSYNDVSIYADMKPQMIEQEIYEGSVIPWLEVQGKVNLKNATYALYSLGKNDEEIVNTKKRKKQRLLDLDE